MTNHTRPRFWETHSLAELNQNEWEALCDSCGLCCLIKLQDDDTAEVAYTRVACHLLDCQTGQCGNYENRHQYVPSCIQLTADMLPTINWLPKTCAYRCLHEHRPLPEWHHLLTGSHQTMLQAGTSAAGRCINETHIEVNDLEDYVVKWVKV